MGMFSALQDKAPNATVSYLSSKIRSKKNRNMDYLDNLSHSQCEHAIQFVVPVARQKRQKKESASWIYS